MSDQELVTGRARELFFGPDFKLEDRVKWLLRKGFKVDMAEAKDGHLEDDRLVMFDGRVFELLDKTDHEYDDVAEARQDEGGLIHFTLKYYNGGTFLDEMFEEAVKKMELKQ